MSPKFLLDTNILSHLLRHPHGVIAARIAAVGEQAVCTSIVVAAELRFGAARRGISQQLSVRVDQLLSAIKVLSLEVPVDRQYGDIREYLARQGMLIGPQRFVDRCACACIEYGVSHC